MTNSEQFENIFVRELVQILASHGLKLEQLADLVDIHPEKIQRLQRSLNSPAFSPLLNPDEMELLVATLSISYEEQGRLQAALLATAIQRLLKEQLGLKHTRPIIEQTYPLLLTTFLNVDMETLGDTIRGQDHDASEDIETDRIWATIWDAMDAADLALQLSRGLSSYTAQVRKIQEARICLEEALTELEYLDNTIKSLPIWHVWHQKAGDEHKAVIMRLQALGEE